MHVSIFGVHCVCVDAESLFGFLVAQTPLETVIVNNVGRFFVGDPDYMHGKRTPEACVTRYGTLSNTHVHGEAFEQTI